MSTDGSDALPLVAGIVYFSPIFAERVMSLHLVEPLDAATYLGQDQGWSIMPVLVLISMMLAVSSNLMIPPPA